MTHIETMKLALEALTPWMDTESDHTEQHKAYYTLRQAIEQAEFYAVHDALEKEAGIHISQQAEQCCCGEPDSLGTHRTDGPCFAPEQAQPVAFDDWYKNAIWGNEDFKAGCHRAWNASLKHNAPPPRQPEQAHPVEYWTVADGWVSEQAEVPAAVWVEPEFWGHLQRVNCATAYRLPGKDRTPLYTAPPPRQPLTDEQIKDVAASCMWWVREQDILEDAIELARAIEAAHGIKGEA